MEALRGFISSGVPIAFYPVLGPEAPGVPTAYSAPPLAGQILHERALVWPSASGQVRGDSLIPLFSGAPRLIDRYQPLYELLSLVDAIRVGQARERKLAIEILAERFAQAAQA